MVSAYNYLNNFPYWISQGAKQDTPLVLPKEIHTTGARKSGKTIAIAETAVNCVISTFMTDKTIVFHCFRKMTNTVEKSVFEEVQKQINKKGLVKGADYIIQKKFYTFKFKNGSEIRCSGLHSQDDKTAKMTGLAGLDTFAGVFLWFEEAFEFSKKDIQDVRESIRGSEMVFEIYSSNPWLASNPYVKSLIKVQPFREAVLKEKGQQLKVVNTPFGVKLYHYTNFLINEFLTKWDRNQLLEIQTTDPKRARTAVWGMPGSEDGLVFSYLMEKVSPVYWYSEIYEYSIGIDYGEKISATTASLMVRDKAFWRVGKIKEAYWSNSDGLHVHKDSFQLARYIVDSIKQWALDFPPIRKGIVAYVDNTATAFMEIMKKEAEKIGLRFVEFRKCKKNDEYLRVDFIRTLMSQGRFFINNECEYGLYEYNNIAWDESRKSGIPKILDKDNHTFDSDIYALMTWWNDINRATNRR